MTPQELNSYRLTSMEEPTDEMLAAIMHEAAEDARKSNQEALQAYFAELDRMIASAQEKRAIYSTMH